MRVRLLLLFLVLLCGGIAHADGRPNILFFLVDDQRNDTLGCAGHPVLQTPHVDLLAAEGTRFTNAYVTTSICAASRASILTGLYERTHGYTFGAPPIAGADVRESYPALLRDAGYRTGFIGKFGVNIAGLKPGDIFDSFTPLERNPYFHPQPDGSNRHETDLAADHAVAFLGEQAKDEPFCLSISFNAAHAEDGDLEDHYPWPPSTDGMYETCDIPQPRLGEDYFQALPEFLQTSMNRIRWHWRWDTPEKYDKNMRAYFRMITGVDNAIGRVLEALKTDGLAENTIIVYAADNGYYMGDRGLAGKWSHFEESMRIPMIVYDPRAGSAQRGRTLDPMVLNIDLPATFLDWGGVAVPKHYQGASLQPLLRGETEEGHTEFFCEHRMNHKDIPKWEGVHTGQYVYARYYEQQPPYEFLHDLRADPTEKQNFVDDDAYTKVLHDLQQKTAAMSAHLMKEKRE
ncbi:MAG: sulfatase-like hydrolase/transferase [Candidatus Hydrogenedens sp.]|nr:sulfatase-like hydrolase/transferase [Candidatus Hydrogenedens sp.]